MSKQVRPIIFLDIDGVFNCQLHYESLNFKNYTFIGAYKAAYRWVTL